MMMLSRVSSGGSRIPSGGYGLFLPFLPPFIPPCRPSSTFSLSISLSFRIPFLLISTHLLHSFGVNCSTDRPSHVLFYDDLAFSAAAARAWNSLPLSVTSSASLPVFRKRLKTRLFTHSFPSWKHFSTFIFSPCLILSFYVLGMTSNCIHIFIVKGSFLY